MTDVVEGRSARHPFFLSTFRSFIWTSGRTRQCSPAGPSWACQRHPPQPSLPDFGEGRQVRLLRRLEIQPLLTLLRVLRRSRSRADDCVGVLTEGIGVTVGVGPGSGVQPATSRPRTRTAPQLPTVRRLTTLPPPLWRATLYKTGGRCEPAARGDRVHHDEHHTSCVPVPDHDLAQVLVDLYPD